MAIIPEQNVQELFRSLDQPFCHYLVWYLVLILSFEIKDITEVLIRPETGYWVCNISRKEHELELTITLHEGKYSVSKMEGKPHGNLDRQSKRRIRIQGKPDDVRGYAVMIYDADTGEAIDNVYRAVIVLDANEENKVTLTYYVSGQDSSILAHPLTNEAMAETITVDNPVISDITAYEFNDETGQ